MRIFLALVFTLSILAGCAKPWTWVKAGYTDAGFKKDGYECERDTRQSGGFGGALFQKRNIQAFYDRCMESKGWRKKYAR